MPSGRTHDIITAVTTPILGGVSYFITRDIKTVLILMSIYLFASLMFNGDLDTISKPYRRWFIFRWIWYPYRKMFEHRSIWTHGIIIGTVVRIIYFTIILSIVLITTYYITDIFVNDIKKIGFILKTGKIFNLNSFETILFLRDLSWSSINWNIVIIVFLGLELGNTIHTLSDKFVSKIG